MKKKISAAIIVILMMGMMSSCIHVHHDPQTGEEQATEPAQTEEQVTETAEGENASNEPEAVPEPQPEPDKSGQTSQNDIGAEKATEIAMADAGVKAKDAVLKYTAMDYDDGFKMYEVEFFANDKEYSYEIDVTNGEILSREAEMMDAEDYMEMEALKKMKV